MLAVAVRRIALEHFELLLDRHRETNGRICERVQRFPGEYRRDQSEENDCANIPASISD